jgi:hypothetical protein
MYTRILYVYDSIDPPSNFPYRKYVKIREYVHIHTIYDTNIRHTYIQYKSVDIYMYMYVYAHGYASQQFLSAGYAMSSVIKMTGSSE